jgi:hypothetical protein
MLILSKLFIICFLIWSCNNVRTTKISDVKFNDVVLFATAHFNDSLACLANVEHIGYFDFQKLAVVDTEPSMRGADRSVWICEVDGSISTVTMSLQAASFRFKVVANSTHNYVVLYPSYKSYEVWNPVNGFILVFNDQCYFVPFEQYPLCVMQLDSALNVVQTVRSLRFRTDSLIYKTVIDYHDGNRIYSETFLELKERLAVNSTTTLDAMISLLKNGIVTGKQMELRVGLTPEDENLPLWMEGGHHEYDYDVIDNNIILPLQR